MDTSIEEYQREPAPEGKDDTTGTLLDVIEKRSSDARSSIEKEPFDMASELALTRSQGPGPRSQGPGPRGEEEDARDSGSVDKRGTESSNSSSSSSSSKEENETVDTGGDALHQVSKQFMSQFDVDRMKITQQEYDWALAIKKTIEGTPDLSRMTDFMYCQLGIVGGGDVEWAMNKAYQIQEHKKENGILDTVEHALSQIPDLVKDRCLLSIDYNLHQGGYILAYDGPKFDLTIFNSKERVKSLLQRIYYMPLIASPDFAAIRAGHTGLYECEGMKMGVNMMSLKNTRKLLLASSVYPAKLSQLKFYNTPMVWNFIVSMSMKSLPEGYSSGFKFGCTFPGGRLDKFFNIPNAQVAEKRFCVKLEELIRRKYNIEKLFSLDNAEICILPETRL